MKLPHAKKLSSGRWRVQTTADGKRISVTADTKTEAESKAMLLKLRQNGSPKDRKNAANGMTLSQLIDLYIEDTEEALSPSTVASYRKMQKYRFKSIMDSPVSESTNWQYIVSQEMKAHVVRVYKGKVIETDKTLSPKTIKNAWGLIETALQYFSIPVPDVRLPKGVQAEHKFLEPDEIRIFLKAIEGHRYELPYLLCLHGLRRSEMIVISKSSIVIPKAKDKKPYIRVRGAAVYDEHNKLVEKKQNKTVLSTRDVPVFVPRLLTLVEAMPDGKLCTANPNSLIHPLNSLLRKNDLPETGLQGLRHTMASLCYHLRVPTLVTKKWGGWSKKSTVVETIYTHLARKDEADSLIKMEEFYKEFT